MPIYDFECLTCKHKFEVLQTYSEEGICPECGGFAERLPSASGYAWGCDPTSATTVPSRISKPGDPS